MFSNIRKNCALTPIFLEIDNISVNRPDTTISHLRNLMPFEHKQDLEKVLGDLEKAGLPE